MKHLFLPILLLAFLCIAPMHAFATQECATGADIGKTYCTCDDGTSTFEVSGSSFDAASCNSACYERGDSSWTLESCDSPDATNPGFSSIDQGNVSDPTAAATSSSIEVTEEQAKDYLVPTLLVPIPGFSNSDNENNNFSVPTTYSDGSETSVNFLAEYINAVYGWILGAAALIAVVMMMIGGLQYTLARGKPKYIDKAKTRITNAITGMVLLLAAFNVAYLIDPNTVTLQPLNVRTVDMVKLVEDSGDASGAGATPDSSTVAAISPSIICDNASSLYDIAFSTVGRVTYRYGGKFGGGPPYQDGDSKINPSGVLYRTYCPDDQLCLDCSGYINFLRQCAGLPEGGESGGTAGIFSGSKSSQVTSYTDTTINGTALIPGDLIGFPTVTIDGVKKIGHVVLYIGNGKIAQAVGGQGRKDGQAVKISGTSEFISPMIKIGQAVYLRNR